MIQGKKRIIRRKKGSGPSVLYFHQGTHDSIVKYQKEQEKHIREQIYTEEILPAFDKLVDNLIYMHGFAGGLDPHEDLKSDCVTFLYETLFKFDSTRGSKAFSYFNVVAKNWLIIKSKQKNKRMKKQASLDEMTSMTAAERKSVIENQLIPGPEEKTISEERREEILDTLREIRWRVEAPNDFACIDAIIAIFENVNNLDFLNKRAIFVYLRDLSNLNPKQLSASMALIRKHYKEIRAEDRLLELF